MEKSDFEFLKDKKVLIVDIVISTGKSVEAIEKLVIFAKGNVVGKIAVFAEGGVSEHKDIVFLEKLLLFL